ncbi:respiratory nitrate reductase chaperone NarJ [Selenomonas sp. WCT3]|uniref:nitrate reductase molybdenum cofactor assembly chaperone n=1 Tax=Selenomonas sp. WCT3 TaxID=3158785 RepID=UPI00087F0C0F|nr:respiratory nitrate reductase chaperone NarJ [Selenomonas ruminantium]
MGAQEYKETLSLAAYLFDYPDAKWWESLKEARLAAEKAPAHQIREELLAVIDYIQEMGQKEYEEWYVRVFEFSANTNLYLTMHNRTDFGRQSKDMLEFKRLFLENGFDTNKELPDYLPAVLELSAALSRERARDVLAVAAPKLELLRSRFAEAKLAHTFLLDVILTTAEELESETA